MKKIIKIVFHCWLVLTFFTFANAQADNVKAEKIDRIIKLSKTLDNIEIQIQLSLGYFKGRYPNVPENEWRDLVEDIKSDYFYEMVFTIYDAEFTPPEIELLEKFYNAPSLKEAPPDVLRLLARSTQLIASTADEIKQQKTEKLKAILLLNGYDVSEDVFSKELNSAISAGQKDLKNPAVK